MAHSAQDTALDAHPRRRHHELRAAAAAAAAAEGHQRGVPAAHPAGERVPLHVPRQEMCGQWPGPASLVPPCCLPRASGLGLGGREVGVGEAARGPGPWWASWPWARGVRAGAAGRRPPSLSEDKGVSPRRAFPGRAPWPPLETFLGDPRGGGFSSPEPQKLTKPGTSPVLNLGRYPCLTMPEVGGVAMDRGVKARGFAGGSGRPPWVRGVSGICTGLGRGGRAGNAAAPPKWRSRLGFSSSLA